MEPLRERVADIVCEVSDDSGNYQTRLPQKKLNAFTAAIMQAVEEDRAALIKMAEAATREQARAEKAEAREAALVAAIFDALTCVDCHNCAKHYEQMRATRDAPAAPSRERGACMCSWDGERITWFNESCPVHSAPPKEDTP